MIIAEKNKSVKFTIKANFRKGCLRECECLCVEDIAPKNR